MFKKSLHFSHILLFVSVAMMVASCKNRSVYTNTTKFEWSTDFEAGAAENLHCRKDGSIGFSIPKDPGGNEYLWFYFKVSSDSKKPLEFVLENAESAHQTGWRWKISRPLFSTDGRTWIRAKETSYKDVFGLASKLGRRPVFRFRSPITADTLWVAYSYPYTNSDLTAFLKTIENSQNVAISALGKSQEGREIVKVQIIEDQVLDKEKKPWIWFIGREHPGETPLSFVCEGIIGALLNSIVGDRLRENFDFTLIPMLNVDGVAHGYYYHNASGINLSTDWVEFKSGEVRVLRDALSADIQNRDVRLLINLHSANDPTKGHFFLIIPSDKLKDEDAKFQKRLLLAADKKHPQLQAHSTVHLRTMSGITGNALYRDFGLYNFYLESNYSAGADGSIVTPQSLREVGAALVEALSQALVPEE